MSGSVSGSPSSEDALIAREELLSNVRERAALLGSVTSLSTIVTLFGG